MTIFQTYISTQHKIELLVNYKSVISRVHPNDYDCIIFYYFSCAFILQQMQFSHANSLVYITDNGVTIAIKTWDYNQS